MTFEAAPRVFETSITTGTGDYTLDGAEVGFQSFASGIGANNECEYHATDDTNWEEGIGKVLSGPARLQRVTITGSSNGGSAVNWGAGTRKIRNGRAAHLALPVAVSKSVAGSSNVTLTQAEQRCDVLTLTGALTGNIEVRVDATPWAWARVHNNTSGAFTLTFLVTGQTGVVIPQGGSLPLVCNGTDVVRVGDFARNLPAAFGRNIAARTNASTPNSKIDITADELIVADALGNALRLASVSVTIDIAVEGALGFDNLGADAEDADTWYYGWVLAKPDGTATGVLSKATTLASVVLTHASLAGYRFGALVSAVRNNGSSNFIPYTQKGRRVTYNTSSAALLAASITSSSETSFTYAGLAPSIAQEVSLDLNQRSTVSTSTGTNEVYLRTVSGGGVVHGAACYTISGVALGTSHNNFDVANMGTLYLQQATTTNAPVCDAYVTGFLLQGGGQ